MGIFDQIVECLDQLRRRAEEHLQESKPKSHHKYQVSCESAVAQVDGAVAMEVIVVVRLKKSGNIVGEEIITRSDGPSFFDVCVGTLNSLDKELKEWRVGTAKKFLKEALAAVQEKKPTSAAVYERFANKSHAALGDERVVLFSDEDDNVYSIQIPEGCYFTIYNGAGCDLPN